MGKLNSEKKLTEAQKKLAEENFWLIDEFFRKNPSFDKEEYWGVAAIVLCEACSSSFSGESSFKTYVFNCMKNWILNEIKKSNRQKRNCGDILYLDDEIKSDKDSKRRESYDAQAPKRFDNDPYFGFLIKEVCEKARMTKIEKVVFLSELGVADYTDTIPALKSGHYSKYRTDMERKLKKFYFPCEKTA